MEFQSLFMESKGQPIFYKGKKIILSDKITLPNSIAKIEYEILSTDSEWLQGIMFKGIGT